MIVRRIFVFTLTLLLFGFPNPARAAAPKTPEDFEREAKIAEFTKKMQGANYPALFEKAAKEFNVPVQILEGISFAETRWEHFIWPPGETVSPENGMPRPYGIMSLWDNDFFGHNLVDAAKLIGKTSDDLKNDPLNNMRGAAAFLRQLYDKTPKPEGTAEGELESWRYAMADYTGIPDPDLKHQHALDIFEYLSQGYNEFGIKFDAVPNLKLEPMRAEVKKIKEEERVKREAKFAAEHPEEAAISIQTNLLAANVATQAVARITETNGTQFPARAETQIPTRKRGWVMAVLAGIAAVALLFFLTKRKVDRVRR